MSVGPMASACGLLLVLLLAVAGGVRASCSAQNCPAVDDQFYTVHIVPHSHMDLGWLKTVEQYFFGTNAHITSVGVQYIYDSVLAELLTDPRKRFMFVETGFFELWWNHRNNATRENFKRLVMNGQIEFVSGGYVMNDEAAVHYQNTIDQMTYGLGILKEKFGQCGVSRIGWQIDPFGHSREFASLIAQMGFEGLYLGRIDYQDKDYRESNLTMEFNWQASESLPQARLTGVVLANNYSPPPGFCFDEFCDDEVIVEDPQAEEYNGPKRAKDLVKWLADKGNFFGTNNFLVTMGNDFNYQNAHKWMSNLDALMRLINGKGFKIHDKPVRLVYSTPSCYLATIKNQNMQTKTDDFFPYASDPHAYWTGYFTSRPAFKFFDRLANNWYQAVKQLAAMAGLGADSLSLLRRALAIGQHHDAVTGTAKQHVNNDYTRMLSIGLAQAESVASKALAALATSAGGNKPADINFCRGLNISQCDQIDSLTNGKGVSVTAYNPYSKSVHSYVRVPVSTAQSFAIVGRNGKNVSFDVMPISDGVKHLAERNGKATHELVFPIDIEPLSFSTVTIQHRSAGAGGRSIPWSYPALEVSQPQTVSRGSTSVRLHPTLGMTHIRVGDVEADVQAGFHFYPSHDGNNTEFEFRASGAYIFRNAGPAEKLPLISQQVIHGVTTTEVRTEYGPTTGGTPWAYQTLRIGDKGDIEIDWIAGPIPIDDGRGKELIWRIDSDIQSGDKFMTDSNGRENILRQRNFRPTWPLSIVEPVAGNYFPVNSLIAIQDDTRHLAILTDRSQGGSSLKSGQLELMLHRRCLHDDSFGVGEALNETGYDGRGLQIRGTYRVVLRSSGEAVRDEALRMALRPIVAFTADPVRFEQNLVDPSALPDNVHLLTLDQTGAKEYLVRLENIFEKKDNSKVSSVDLQQLFGGSGGLKVTGVRETLLAANIDRPAGRSKVNTKVTLHPMQIRTFFVTLN